MAGKPKKKRGRPPTGIRRPVITLRVHENIYETIRRGAKQRKLTLSEETARLIGTAIDRRCAADRTDQLSNAAAMTDATPEQIVAFLMGAHAMTRDEERLQTQLTAAISIIKRLRDEIEQQRVEIERLRAEAADQDRHRLFTLRELGLEEIERLRAKLESVPK